MIRIGAAIILAALVARLFAEVVVVAFITALLNLKKLIRLVRMAAQFVRLWRMARPIANLRARRERKRRERNRERGECSCETVALEDDDCPIHGEPSHALDSWHDEHGGPPDEVRPADGANEFFVDGRENEMKEWLKSKALGAVGSATMGVAGLIIAVGAWVQAHPEFLAAVVPAQYQGVALALVGVVVAVARLRSL